MSGRGEGIIEVIRPQKSIRTRKIGEEDSFREYSLADPKHDEQEVFGEELSRCLLDLEPRTEVKSQLLGILTQFLPFLTLSESQAPPSCRPSFAPCSAGLATAQ
jgi:hypothetical protein